MTTLGPGFTTTTRKDATGATENVVVSRVATDKDAQAVVLAAVDEGDVLRPVAVNAAGQILTTTNPPPPSWAAGAAWAADPTVDGQPESLLLLDRKGGTDGYPTDDRGDLRDLGYGIGTSYFDGVDAFAVKPATRDTDPDDDPAYDGPWCPAVDLTDGWRAWVDCASLGVARVDGSGILQHVEMAQGVSGGGDADDAEPDLYLGPALNDAITGKIRTGRWDTDTVNRFHDFGAPGDVDAERRHVSGWNLIPNGTTSWTDEAWRRYPDQYETPDQQVGFREVASDPKLKVGAHPLKLGYGRGFYYRAKVRKPDGTLLAHFDASQFGAGDTTWTDEAGNLWTVPADGLVVPAGTDAGWVQTVSSYFTLEDAAANPGATSWAMRAKVFTHAGWRLGIGQPGGSSGLSIGDLSAYGFGAGVGMQDGSAGIAFGTHIDIDPDITCTLAVVVDRAEDELRTYRDGTLIDTTDISALGAVVTSDPFVTAPSAGTFLLHELGFYDGVPAAGSDFIAS